MITQQKQIAQVSVPQVWDTLTATAQVGDYIRVPFVPVMCVVDRDELEGGHVWLLLKPTTASYTEEWVLEPESAVEAQQPATEPQPQPEGNAWDKVSYQLQPATEATTEFEQGRLHGRNDARAKWHPIYKEPATEYATGYLSGYNDVLNPKTQPIDASTPQEWSVTYDPKWQWYQAWVGFSYIGQGTTHQEAERLAQKYIAMNELIRQQNAAVMAAVAA